jgi:hypothetical protein
MIAKKRKIIALTVFRMDKWGVVLEGCQMIETQAQAQAPKTGAVTWRYLHFLDSAFSLVYWQTCSVKYIHIVSSVSRFLVRVGLSDLS